MFVPDNKKAPRLRGFSSAPKRTRTSTDQMVHKALNLAWRSPPAPSSQFTCKPDTSGDSADESDVTFVAAVLPPKRVLFRRRTVVSRSRRRASRRYRHHAGCRAQLRGVPQGRRRGRCGGKRRRRGLPRRPRQAGCAAVVCRQSLRRLCVAGMSCHSVRAAAPPRRWTRSRRRLNLVSANTGSKACAYECDNFQATLLVCLQVTIGFVS